MPEVFLTKRTRITVRDTQLLRRGDEKRHHFRLSIDLSAGDDTLTGMPSWIQDNYSLIQKSASRADRTKLKTRLENMALELFPTAAKSSKRFFPIITGATLAKFSMERVGEGDTGGVTLNFSAYFPGRKEIHEWTYDHKSADCWLMSEQQQGVLEMQPVVGESEDVPDEEEEEGETNDSTDDGEDSPSAQKRRAEEKAVRKARGTLAVM